MTNDDYTPVDCAFHDRFEHHAVRGDQVSLRLDNAKPIPVRIKDVFAKDGADWIQIQMENGSSQTVRLDRVTELNGLRPATRC